MTIRCEVLSVKENGDNLEIVCQGQRRYAAPWRDMQKMTIQIPDSEVARRTYYLGRAFNVTVTPV